MNNLKRIIAIVFILLTQLGYATSITFTFANGQITGTSPLYYEFDVMAQAGDAGTKIGDNLVYIDYNTLGFGPNIVANNKITVTRGVLVGGSFYNLVINDNTSSKVSLATEYLLPNIPSLANNLLTTPDTLLHVKIEIANPLQTAGLSFDQGLMGNPSQQYQSDNTTIYDPVIATDTDDSPLSGGGIPMFQQDISGGWNMIGLPLEVVDTFYKTLYPGSVDNTLFTFNGSYELKDSLERGTGYWLRFPADETVVITGTEINSITVDLLEGWNMIAGASCGVDINNVSDPGGIIVQSTLFSFNGSYVLSDTIEQGRGYWLRANSAGQITIDCNAPPQKLTKNAGNLPDISGFPVLKLSDATGASQSLYFDVELDNPENLLSFSMPPLPPAGAFDARFSGDFRISQSSEATILLQASQYPVTISAENLPVIDQYQYVIKETVAGKEVAVHTVKEGSSITISNPNVKTLKLSKEKAIPLTFEVSQNYPNPFNPTTLIKYVLPNPERVEIKIYNALGQKVKTLVSGHKEAGFYEAVWDATNDAGQRVGSGLYFYTVKAGENSDIKKMILLK